MDPNYAIVDDGHFEREVRRIGRILWPNAPLERSPIVDGLERDAIIATPDIVIVLEATTSRRKDKIEHDGKKTNDLVKKIRSQGKSCKGIVVTLHEPTADQEEEAKKFKSTLNLESFEQFLARIFDAPQYLSTRLTKPFGSIQNPKTTKFHLDRDVFIPIPFIDDVTQETVSIDQISNAVRMKSARVVISADFGSGKSMALREVFFQLRDSFLKKQSLRFPLYINLRDHLGAKYPDEILERHGREIGLSDHTQLVRAWRAGFVDLLLDGFDEFAATGWSSSPFKLRQIRRANLGAVRTLIRESPSTVGILIAGRQHYFDSPREMAEALGLGDEFRPLRIETLSNENAEKIVRRYGGKKVPDWVPYRALLLSYLAARDFLAELNATIPTDSARGEGWNALLTMICQREKEQHRALDESSILTYIERLASRARQTSDGLGSFSEEDLASLFQATCGFPADDAAKIFISRLPGLGPIAQESGRRRFIDQDIADAARAGDVYRYIRSPYDEAVSAVLKEAQVALGPNGLERLSYLAEKACVAPAVIEVAAETASKHSYNIVALDTLQLLQHWNANFTKSHVDVRDVQFESIEFDETSPDFGRVAFWDCMFERFVLAPDADPNKLPKFYRCLIGSLDGISSKGDLPEGIFVECEVVELATSMARNAEILDTDLPIATKVLLTILNKLFMQAGRGRRENAFARGLDTRAKALVPEILYLVESFHFAAPIKLRNQTIWFPDRDKTKRVYDILARPILSDDPLVVRIRNL